MAVATFSVEAGVAISPPLRAYTTCPAVSATTAATPGPRADEDSRPPSAALSPEHPRQRAAGSSSSTGLACTGGAGGHADRLEQGQQRRQHARQDYAPRRE